MSVLSRSSAFYLCLVGFMFGIIFVYFLSIRPFGWLFWSAIYFSITSLLGLLTLLFMKMFRSTSYWKKIIGGISCLAAIIILSVSIAFELDFFAPPSVNKNLTDQQWEQDLNHLLTSIQKRHPTKTTVDNSDQFKQAVVELKQKLHSLSTNQKIIEFNRIIALLNDGHSSLWPLFDPANFRAFPLKTYSFDDDLYIIDSSREYQQHIGAKIVGIGNLSIEETRARLSDITGAENNIGETVRFSLYVMLAELLEAEGIIENADIGVFTLENTDGDQYTIEIEPETATAWYFWYMYRFVDNKASSAFHNLRSDFYWFEYLEESKTIYFQFNIVQNDIFFGETLAEFTARLNDFANSTHFDRFIIDIRNNNGGNGQLLHPLIDMIANNPNINQKEKLFTITGRHTFSAAVMFAMGLENRTKSLFVGESMGATPNHYGDAEFIELPHSGLKILLSEILWENSITEDSRATIIPDLPVRYTHQDFVNSSDPAVDAIFNYQAATQPITTVDFNESAITGRYLFGTHKIATISTKQGSLNVNITDFSPRGFADVDSELYPVNEKELTTDIKGVTLRILNQDKGKIELYFDWRGIKKPLTPVEDSYRLALELIISEQYEQAFEKLKGGLTLPKHLNLESILNQIGYKVIENNSDLAIEIFEYNTQLNSLSSNAFDSLAEAYLRAGKKELAIINYQKALDLDHSNTNALNQLELIKKS